MTTIALQPYPLEHYVVNKPEAKTQSNSNNCDGAPAYCTKDMLAILGTAETMHAAPFQDDDHEIWGVAMCQTYPSFKRADILFELHGRSYWGKEPVMKRLNAWDGRLLMQDHYEEIPRSERYPIETILNSYRPYHRTSITYMLALAYHSYLTIGKPVHVGLYGVHMEHVREEYAEQRPCCEYWLGRMESAGMDIFIAGGAILAAPFLYGYEKYNPLSDKIHARLEALTNGMHEREKEELEKRLQKHEQIGAMAEAEYWLRLSQRGELQWDSTEDIEPPPNKSAAS